MPWYYYALEFVAGLFLTNGVPHFVQGVSGNPFPSPFASPPGIGNSPPLVNAMWGFANWVVAFVLLWFFGPAGPGAWVGWILIGIGMLLMALMLSRHFGKTRAGRA